MRTIDLRTLIPAVVTPMTPDCELDEKGIRRYLGWVKDQGIRVVAVNADTGEGPQLSRDERRRVVEIAAEIFSGQVIAGLYAGSTREAAEIAGDAFHAGAAALLMFPLPLFRERAGSERVIFEYHRAIAESVDLGMVIFHLQPALGGAEYSPDLLARLIELPNAVALKEATFDVRSFTETVTLFRQLPKKITLLTGNDNFIMQSFLLGAEGALLGFGTLAVREQLEMIQALREHNYRRAWELHSIVQPLADAIFASPVREYRGRAKEALRLAGVIENSVVRPPLLALDEGERRRVREAMERAHQLRPAAAARS